MLFHLVQLRLDDGQPKILLQANLRWNIISTFLLRVNDFSSEIIIFLKKQFETCANSNDVMGPRDQVFLMDFILKFIDLNLVLQEITS